MNSTLGTIFTGHADHVAYDLGLLPQTVPFEQLRQGAYLNELANRFQFESDYSRLIRR